MNTARINDDIKINFKTVDKHYMDSSIYTIKMQEHHNFTSSLIINGSFALFHNSDDFEQ